MNNSDRLSEILDEMRGLMEEAKDIVRVSDLDEFSKNRAKYYWMNGIDQFLEEKDNNICVVQETVNRMIEAEKDSSQDDTEGEDWEEDWKEAQKEHNLPEYVNEVYKRFAADCFAEGFELQHYNGRRHFSGPGVVVSDIQEVIRCTEIPVVWDNMGRDYIVYPK